MQAVRQSSLAIVRQHDSTALNQDPRLRHTALDGPHGSGPARNPNSRLRSEPSAPASRSAGLSPNALVVRAWRSLIELRIDDALATVAQFEEEIARAEAPVAPRSREIAEVLRAVLLVLKSRDGAMVRAALGVLENRHQSDGKSASRVTEALTPREHSVLCSMSCGLSNKRIAQELQIAPETVKSHVKGIFIKLAVQTRAHAVSTAGALGLL